MILERLKEDAETFLGQKVKDAVITIPAYFNISQRQATIDAARIAGLNVKELINEPVAAAIAYGLENHLKEKKNICVFDLGGGTFDVTILEIDNNKFTVKAIGGDSHLGGIDFDNELIKYCIEKFKEENDIDISNDQKALRRLKVACEKAKIDLSNLLQTNIDLENLYNGIDFNLTISKIDFENICESYFNKAITILKETIKDSNILENEIDNVVLVGGSTRIPKVEEMLNQFFGENKILNSINKDEAVAYGATYYSYFNYNNNNNNNIINNVNINQNINNNFENNNNIDNNNEIRDIEKNNNNINNVENNNNINNNNKNIDIEKNINKKENNNDIKNNNNINNNNKKIINNVEKNINDDNLNKIHNNVINDKEKFMERKVSKKKYPNLDIGEYDNFKFKRNKTFNNIKLNKKEDIKSNNYSLSFQNYSNNKNQNDNHSSNNKKILNNDELYINKNNYNEVDDNSDMNINNNENIIVKNVCPLSLGKNLYDGSMSFIIKRNTQIPCRESKVYQTTRDYQKRLSVEVYEGERPFSKDNLYLNTFYIENLKKAKKGETKIKVTFELDSNSILKVFAEEIGNEKNNKTLKIEKKN